MKVIGPAGWLWRLFYLSSVSLLAFAGAGCDRHQTTLPPELCPALPTLWTFTDYGALGHSEVARPGLEFHITPTGPGTIAGNVVRGAPSDITWVTSVFAFLQAGENATPKARAVIYQLDASGSPTGEPLAASAEMEIATFPAHWYRFDFPHGVPLRQGSYLIGIWTGGSGRTLLFAPGSAATLTGFFADSVPYDSLALPPASPSGSQGGKGWALYGLYRKRPVVQFDPSTYTPATPAQMTSINLELGQLYMRHRVLEALQATGIENPYPEGGIEINDLRLVQGSATDPNPNTLVVTITPWRRGAQGQHVSLQRSYRMTLKLTTFLLTPETESDASKRSAMLGNDENGQPLNAGVAIHFDLVELHSLSYDENVECNPDPDTGRSTNPKFDQIDSLVLENLSTSLATTRPLIIPTKAVTDAIANLSGSSPTIDGVALATDVDFKLGLHVKGFTGKPFDSQTTLGRFSSVDWAIDVDKAFVISKITSQLTSAATTSKLSPVGAARVEFDPGGTLRVYQKVGGCLSGDIGNVYALARMAIVRIGPIGPPPATRYALGIQVTPDADARVKTCALVNGTYLEDSFKHAQIGNVGGTVCDEPSDIQFKVSPTEWFYATALDTDDIFYIGGRSTSADTWRGPRPPVPACP